MDSEPVRRAFLFALGARLRAAERHEASADLLAQRGRPDFADVARDVLRPSAAPAPTPWQRS